LFLESFTLPSFAKINLALHVLGRRPDGYHELYTVFQTISLQDRLTFSHSADDRISLTCDNQGIPVDKDNLIMRAAKSLRERFDVKSGMSIHLEKRIPWSAGLGGGSSNAAIALLGLAKLWEIDITKHDLEQIGATIGADVPFFFTGGTALGTGLGTMISPLADAPPAYLVVVKPDVEVSTAKAYESLNLPALTKTECDTILSSSCLSTDFSDLLYTGLKNDFESVIFGLYPEIMRARDGLLNQGARNALLAGSGASVFGVFDSVDAQESAEAVLQRQEGWRAIKCATLSRESYLKDLGECAKLVAGSVST
jgi:4-diphosphocytidyl-2-C-methyl-D-erythritol kinase